MFKFITDVKMSWKSHIKYRTQPHFSEVPEAMLSEGS